MAENRWRLETIINGTPQTSEYHYLWAAYMAALAPITRTYASIITRISA